MRWFALTCVALLAGCSSSGGTDDGSSDTADTDMPEGGAAGIPVVTGFNWTKGEAWEHAFQVGNGSEAFTFTYKAAVVAESSSDWTILGSTEEAALADAAFFLGDLGAMGRDGTLRGGAYAMPYYKFPFTANSTWSATESNFNGNTFERADTQLTMTVRWEPTSAVGPRFVIEARRADGSLRSSYDYVPTLDWFSEFHLYSDFGTFHILTKSHADYAGQTFTSVGELLYLTEVFSAGAPAQPQPPVADSFDVTATMTHVLALHFAYGAPGAATTRIVAPDGTMYSTSSAYDPNGNALQEDFEQSEVLVDAQAGTWQVAAAAEGVFVTHVLFFVMGITVAPFAA